VNAEWLENYLSYTVFNLAKELFESAIYFFKQVYRKLKKRIHPVNKEMGSNRKLNKLI